MNIRKNRGITLVALVITVILLLIISGISVTGTIKGQKETESSKQIYELNVIQHAVLERHTKTQLTKEETLPGTDIAYGDVKDVIEDINSKTGGNISLKETTEYKKLNNTDLESLGVVPHDDGDTYKRNKKSNQIR